jgi:hypothetical protein
MATTTDLTTVTDQEARMRAFQIVGSDIGADAVFNGDWRLALMAIADRWAPAPSQATTNPAPAA